MSNLKTIIDQTVDNILETESTQPELLKFFVDQIEALVIERVMQKTNHNKTKASQILGISRSTLCYKIKNYKT